jgi:hypothetical protein
VEAAIEDSRRAGNTSLQRIAALKVADECSAKVAGAPWGDDAKAAQGTVRLEAYRASVAHALRNLKVVYGKMTSAQAASLDKMWAPFYDNPTPAAADWFAHLNPLLDEYIATAAALEENFPAFQESMSDVLVALGEKSATSRPACERANSCGREPTGTTSSSRGWSPRSTTSWRSSTKRAASRLSSSARRRPLRCARW